MNSTLKTFTHAPTCDFADDIIVTVDGQHLEVLRTAVADFTSFVFDAAAGPVTVRIAVKSAAGTPDVPECTIRPVSRAIKSSTEEDGTRVFVMEKPVKLSVEFGGRRPLFLWANAPERMPRPVPGSKGVHYFEAGRIHEIGTLHLQTGETLYVEGGAVVRGQIHAADADNITLAGHGIIDGETRRHQGSDGRLVFLERCRNVVVRDLIMIRPAGWMLVPGGCEQVEIQNLKQIGEVVSSDGIDVVGCRHVRIHDCFLRNNDDCVVIKAFKIGRDQPDRHQSDLRIDCTDILVEDCTFLNAQAGNAMEIGHELSVDRISDITFRDIDVLSVHGHGAVFSIHNFDRAVVEDVCFENIRIEHCYDKFIDFRISASRYSSDRERGQIRNVILRDIQWHRTPFNAGYTVSTIGGSDPQHRVSGVILENIFIDGELVTDLDQLEIHTRHTDDLVLRQRV